MNEIRSKLIQLASEMALGLNMPSEFVEDWGFPKTTPVSAKRTAIRCAELANDQARSWAAKLNYIAKEL
ncbi:MAG: hypothetical protein ACXW0Q_07425 [Methylovulum sp.]